MTPFSDARPASPPPLPDGPRGLIGWVRTNNPFYALSAGLFLAGLWVSFGKQAVDAENNWAMMIGLASYTLLLAVTACLLVRFARVWDDVRTVLLLVVLMFLATSVTLDDMFVQGGWWEGAACYLGSLLVAVGVSEGLLRATRLKLPLGFRTPYYLILAVFFLYPLVVGPVLKEPHSSALMWGLFGFATLAGLVFLTLLPAIRRGPDYLRDNGSPWPWPQYPLVLFGLLACAVPARAYLLCYSLHLLGGEDLTRSIFGGYFLVPFGLAITVLLLEIGLVSRRPAFIGAALALPIGLIILAGVGHRDDSLYQEFLSMFRMRLGGSPLFLTLAASAGFYIYAALRRVWLATEALTAGLIVLAFVGQETVSLNQLVPPQALAILAAAALQLGLGLWRRSDWRCLVGGCCLAAGTAVALPLGSDAAFFRGPIAFHILLAAVLIVGAVFDNPLGRCLRLVGGGLLLLACLAVMFVRFNLLDHVPSYFIIAYPPAMAVILVAYGLVLRHRPSLGFAVLVMACWVGVAGGSGYIALRKYVKGLEYIVVSLVLFALAILTSLAKSGMLSRRGRHGEGPSAGAALPPVTEGEAP